MDKFWIVVDRNSQGIHEDMNFSNFQVVSIRKDFSMTDLLCLPRTFYLKVVQYVFAVIERRILIPHSI